ncbi:MAG TPA: hypothetical protein VFK52_02120 [Nocardioidaceae bacterium]|nr:hypothetical protein [Nocardioidaceae bacterium]
MRRLLVLLVLALPVGLVGGASADGTLEGFADYVPQTKCHPSPLPGTLALAAWIEREFPGTNASTAGRRCSTGGTSEHKEGRAIDWSLDATRAGQRAKARAFLQAIKAPDAGGNVAALARRMGVMYVIWNDHMYAAWDEFVAEDYLSSSCKRKLRCSVTLRHRDHMHISLSRRGGRGLTSWYVANDS